MASLRLNELSGSIFEHPFRLLSAEYGLTRGEIKNAVM